MWRLWDICNGCFPDNLHAVSIYGKTGPLMRLDGNTPVKADFWHWLDATIKNHVGLELLIIEPKSRFYGLDENNNDHATQWVCALEKLKEDNGLKCLLFSHHVGKDSGVKISQKMSRGASGLIDACRWQGGLMRMDEELAKKLSIKNHRNFVLFDVPKANYSPDMPNYLIFQRGENGVLEHYDTEEAREKMRESKQVQIVIQALIKSGVSSMNQTDLIQAIMDEGKGTIHTRTAWHRIQEALSCGLIVESTGLNKKTKVYSCA